MKRSSEAAVKVRTGRSQGSLNRERYKKRYGHRMTVAPKDWITPKRRHAIYARDEWKCYLCGDQLSLDAPANDPKELTLDHVLPRSLGGSHDSENLRTACRTCNVLKSNKMPMLSA